MKNLLHTILLLFGALSIMFVSCDVTAEQNGSSNQSGQQETVKPEEPEEPEERYIPQVHIKTPGGADIVSKEDWLGNTTIKVIDEYGEVDLSTTTSIRGRGNSTWYYPKKPYALKLNAKSAVLGMPKHKRWVLLANWMDRTLLRNDIAYEMGRRMMAWAPRGKFVELYLNGKHMGNYYLCEHIKVDESRVNIAELDEGSDFSDSYQMTGGYILEFDIYGPQDEPNVFYTSVKKYPVAIKEPDEEVITSKSHPGYVYIKNYINSLEQIFEDDKNDLKRWEEIESQIDVQSYIDWWLIHELCCNWEPGHPKSSYMYKERGGKLFAGPVWDFDWGTFMPNIGGLVIGEALWYGYMFKYDEFKSVVKQRWMEVKNKYMELNDYLDTQAEALRESNEVNISMWPITDIVNGDEELDYNMAILRMKTAYNQRIQVIDTFVSDL